MPSPATLLASIMDADTTVKTALYRIIADSARMPDAGEVSQELGMHVDDVVLAFGRLHQKRLLVPEPGDPSRVRMAPPFSGIETPFLVHANGKAYYANCIWDALGVAAALHAHAVVDTCDGHTGEAMRMEVRDGGPVSTPCVAHFAVPAAKWWADIIFT